MKEDEHIKTVGEDVIANLNCPKELDKEIELLT